MSGGTTPSSKPLSPLSPLRLFATFCVLAPTVAVIAVPTYNSNTPRLGGFPFFYWYQLILVVITGVLMVAAYFAIRADERQRKAYRAGAGGVRPDAGAGTGGDAGAPGAGGAALDDPAAADEEGDA
ncbi:MAG TPA: DUF3311 domain-containing protein [Actinospica sp.]|jgi:hypothetical protein|nr:DUF3311 domain-containing protein [Actinospica sp.]